MNHFCLSLNSGRPITVVPTFKTSACLLSSVCCPDSNQSASLLASFDDCGAICVARISPGSYHALNIPLSRKVTLQSVGACLHVFGTRTAGVSFIQSPSSTSILKTSRPTVKHGRSVSFSSRVERCLGDGLIYEVLTCGRVYSMPARPGHVRWCFRVGQTDVVARLGVGKELCEGLDLALRGMRCGEVRKIQVPSGLDSKKTPAGEYVVEFVGPSSMQNI